MSDLSGRCSCGAVTWEAVPPVIWAALCHCEDCRRTASSDYVSWFGVRKESVVWDGPRKCFSSSELVVRSFCEICGSPLSFETDVFPTETHLYATTLNDVGFYHPTAHIFWSEHLPWVKVTDNLPKHLKGLQHAAKSGVELVERASES